MDKRTITLLLGVPAMAGGTALLAWNLGLLTLFVKTGGVAGMSDGSAHADIRQSEAVMIAALLVVSLVGLLLGHHFLYPRKGARSLRIPVRSWRTMAVTLFVLSMFGTIVLLLRGFWTDLAIPLVMAALGFWCISAGTAQAKLDLEQLHPGVRAALSRDGE